jgi:hypothetical protein
MIKMYIFFNFKEFLDHDFKHYSSFFTKKVFIFIKNQEKSNQLRIIRKIFKNISQVHHECQFT